MARNRNGMLGVGGQRRNLSRKALRGQDGGPARGGTDPLAEKRRLIEKMRERNARAEDAPDNDEGA